MNELRARYDPSLTVGKGRLGLAVGDHVQFSYLRMKIDLDHDKNVLGWSSRHQDNCVIAGMSTTLSERWGFR